MPARANSAGFTLIEIMVVLLVIGIGVGIVTLSVSGGGPDVELRKAAERFAVLADFASERAILNSQPVGLLLEPPTWSNPDNPAAAPRWRYRWQRMSPTGWQNEPGLEAVELGESVQLDVTIEEQMWEWDEAPEIRLPVVVFYPSGEVTQFAIEFRDERLPDFAQHVEVNDWGEVVWLEQPRAPEGADNAF